MKNEELQVSELWLEAVKTLYESVKQRKIKEYIEKMKNENGEEKYGKLARI